MSERPFFLSLAHALHLDRRLLGPTLVATVAGASVATLVSTTVLVAGAPSAACPAASPVSLPTASPSPRPEAPAHAADGGDAPALEALFVAAVIRDAEAVGDDGFTLTQVQAALDTYRWYLRERAGIERLGREAWAKQRADALGQLHNDLSTMLALEAEAKALEANRANDAEP